MIRTSTPPSYCMTDWESAATNLKPSKDDRLSLWVYSRHPHVVGVACAKKLRLCACCPATLSRFSVSQATTQKSSISSFQCCE